MSTALPHEHPNCPVGVFFSFSNAICKLNLLYAAHVAPSVTTVSPSNDLYVVSDICINVCKALSWSIPSSRTLSYCYILCHPKF